MMEKMRKVWEDRAKSFDRNWESQPPKKFKAKSCYILNSSSDSASAVGHILQLSSMLSFRSNFLNEGLSDSEILHNLVLQFFNNLIF